MGCTACTEPQCLYKGDLYLYLIYSDSYRLWPLVYLIQIGYELDKTRKKVRVPA